MSAAESVSATAKIVNRRGLHARAAGRFCAVAASFNAKVTVTKDDLTVGGRSIMGLLMLGAGEGSSIVIAATGDDAAKTVETLVRLVADRFGEGE